MWTPTYVAIFSTRTSKTWTTGRDWFRLASVIVGAVMVMKNCAENNLFQVSGKKKIPTTAKVSWGCLYYLFHVPSR